MKKFFTTVLALIVTLTAAFAETLPDKAAREGRALADEICAMGPEKDSTMTATLYIQRDRRTEIAVPIEMKLVKGDKGWKSIYQTRSTNTAETAVLTIHQKPGAQNSYELLSGTNQQPQTIAHNTAGTPFAGSDFWVSDLGLEFFRWKDQRVITNELKNGQACYVLESKNPAAVPGTYSKVISWIDKDTLGIVLAEAYDQNGKLLKLFKPTTVEKVNGRYQVKEVEMRNRQTKLKSRLEFDLKTE
jgi:hypothetical protein